MFYLCVGNIPCSHYTKLICMLFVPPSPTSLHLSSSLPLSPSQHRLSMANTPTMPHRHFSPDQDPHSPLFPFSSDGESDHFDSSSSPELLDTDTHLRPWLTSSPLPVPHSPHQMFPGGMFNLPSPFYEPPLPSERSYHNLPHASPSARPYGAGEVNVCLSLCNN